MSFLASGLAKDPPAPERLRPQGAGPEVSDEATRLRMGGSLRYERAASTQVGNAHAGGPHPDWYPGSHDSDMNGLTG